MQVGREAPSVAHRQLTGDYVATALAAIRNLDGYELNGRKLRVSYSNNSNLKDYAKEIGQDLSENYQSSAHGGSHGGSSSGGNAGGANSLRTIESIVAALKMHEAFDILSELKALALSDARALRELLEANPALISAATEMQRKLGMQVVPPPLLANAAPHNAPQQPFASMSLPASRVIAAPAMVSSSVDSFFASFDEPVAPSRSYPTSGVRYEAHQEPASGADGYQRAQLMEQVMALSEDDLMRLPPEKREQMMQLRGQYSRAY